MPALLLGAPTPWKPHWKTLGRVLPASTVWWAPLECLPGEKVLGCGMESSPALCPVVHCPSPTRNTELSLPCAVRDTSLPSCRRAGTEPAQGTFLRVGGNKRIKARGNGPGIEKSALARHTLQVVGCPGTQRAGPWGWFWHLGTCHSSARGESKPLFLVSNPDALAILPSPFLVPTE